LTTTDYISAEIIPEHFKEKPKGIKLLVDDDEKERIENAMKIARNNLPKAAGILDMDTKILLNKIKIYKISNE
jgi:DNA-binding NtrC family response regulator